jgi:Bacterial TniB protein
MRQDAELGDHGANQQWQNAAHEAFLIAPSGESNTGTITAPVLYVQCPGFPDESRLYTAILLKLCKKFRPSAPAQEKLVLVLDALSKIEIRILALDEVNFTEVGTAAKQKRFLNALRYLANELRISIVCLGTEEMMRSSAPSPQLKTDFRRWSFRNGNLITHFDSCWPRSKRSFRSPIHPVCQRAALSRQSFWLARRARLANLKCSSPRRQQTRCAREQSGSPKKLSMDATIRLRRHESSGPFLAEALRY